MRRIALLAAGILLSVFLWAEDAPPEESDVSQAGAEGEAIPATAIYIPLKPQFVVNYGGAGRLRYLKAEVAVRLADAETANAVRHHMPYIRNNLVMLFAGQTNETIGSQEGKEAMRRDALEEVRKVLKQEEGIAPEAVVGLYFNTLFIQK
ncbi:flagellar basal body-associated FliL family protein [Teredinibacter sp. KSP-S5-2]|uniref:flagellar basal body-associated FliL family protein n=1 Tax=Teredinibacter sp. KSP-S5-2 TaxID=3034506 RepID=UPI002934A61C|nr:flagellar basal body-associated FliL family protein [Teredinibacter sp. KSP-S5-2]WNO08984.1 flagellar basal body-associated FliL family protein [Teredinibacter sp. KSP-S5-2]